MSTIQGLYELDGGIWYGNTISNSYRPVCKYSDNLERFFDIIKRVFPEKYEEKYAKLSELAINYSFISSSIQSLTKKDDYNSISIGYDEDELKELYEKLTNKELEARKIEEIINHIPVDNVNFDRLHYLNSLMVINKERIELQSQLTRLSIEKNDKLKKMHFDNYSFSELHERMQTIIEEIKNTLDEIKKIEINGQDRLNNIKVKTDHMESIDKLIDSYDFQNDFEKKEKTRYAYKYFLLETIRLRKNQYKAIERVSNEIIEKYDNRELLDSDNEDILLSKIAMITTDRYEISDIIYITFSNNHYGLTNFDDYKELNYISECYSTISDLMDKKNNNDITIEDIKSTREKLRDMEYNLGNSNISTYTSIFNDPISKLLEYETNLKKESGMSF